MLGGTQSKGLTGQNGRMCRAWILQCKSLTHRTASTWHPSHDWLGGSSRKGEGRDPASACASFRCATVAAKCKKTGETQQWLALPP